MNNFFIIKGVEFENRKEDPFRFDGHAGKVADKYLQFSGSMRKPVYLLFTAYVNHLLKSNKLNVNGLKDKEVKQRMEKLLVVSWKGEGGTNVIGSRIRNPNPFNGRDGNWVVQDCFKIYQSSAKDLVTENILDFYISKTPKEIDLLNEFLSYKGHLSNFQSNLIKLLQKFSKSSYSLFNGNPKMNVTLQKKMRNVIKSHVTKRGFEGDESFINALFPSDEKKTKSYPEKLNNAVTKTVNSDKYEFVYLNIWFSAFVLAVDDQINGGNSEKLWKNADKAHKEVSNKMSFPFSCRPKPVCWFMKPNGKYIKEPKFDDAGWAALVKRAKYINGMYYDFKLTALESLLRSL